MSETYDVDVRAKIKADESTIKDFSKQIAKRTEEEVTRTMKRVFGSKFVQGVQSGIGLSDKKPEGFAGKAGAAAGGAALMGGAFMAILGPIGIIAGILTDVFPPLKLFLSIFKVIGMLLFLPLYPILIPLIKLLLMAVPVIRDVMMAIREKVQAVVDALGAVFLDVGEAIAPILSKAWDIFVAELLLIWVILKAVFNIGIANITLVWELLKNVFMLLIGVLTGNKEMIDKAIKGITTAFTEWTVTIKKVFRGVIDAITSFIDSINPFGKKSKKVSEGFYPNVSPKKGSKKDYQSMTGFTLDEGITIGDAIITKDGKVIHTDPQDNIMAFKGGMPGGSTVININIDKPTLRSDSDIKDLVRQIESTLQRQYRGRVSYMGGI